MTSNSRDADACEIAQPWPSQLTVSTRPPDASVRTRSVTSSPQVGFTWWDSAFDGSVSPYPWGLRA